jgi:GH24 family phage-related lysozyme (muramidase)
MSYPQLPLKQGSRGAAVFEVQRALRARERWVVADGNYGPMTTAAVKKYQQDFHLGADGTVGPDTWNFMFPTLREGSPWPGAVGALQTSLRQKGYKAADHDGTFGPHTKAATVDFQQHHKLKADGVVGTETWFVLLGGNLPLPSAGGAPGTHPSQQIAVAIGHWEGCILPYAKQDIGGVWTIGYGYTIGVGPHTGPWTQQHALDVLHSSLDSTFAPSVRAVGVPLNQKQFDALISFTYNVGSGAIAAGSSVGNALRAHNYSGAANDLLGYTHAAGQVLPGLVRRREWEKQLFLGGTYTVT